MKNLPFSKTPPKVTEEYIQNQILEILRGEFDLKKGLLDRIAAIPLRFRLQYVKALFCPGKKAVAIKMKCYECVGFEIRASQYGDNPGTWVDRIWFDVSTKLPARIEHSGRPITGDDSRTSTTICDEFNYAGVLSAETFTPRIPAGFINAHPDELRGTAPRRADMDHTS